MTRKHPTERPAGGRDLPRMSRDKAATRKTPRGRPRGGSDPLVRVRRAVQTFLREQPEARAALISYLDAQSAHLKADDGTVTP
jgi:hypothetical protein